MKNKFYITCIAVLISYSGLQAQDSRSFDFYLSNLQQLDLSQDASKDLSKYWTEEYLISSLKKQKQYNSYVANNKQEIHYVTYCGDQHSGFAILFEIKNDKPELLYKKFNLGCASNPRVEDIDGDGNKELIIETGGGGTGVYCTKQYIFFSQNVSNPIQYFKSCYETACPRYMFSSPEREEIYERLGIKFCEQTYSSEFETSMKVKNKEIDLFKTKKISFENPALLDEFIKLNPNYPNGTCSYQSGKIILENKIELTEFPNECKKR